MRHEIVCAAFNNVELTKLTYDSLCKETTNPYRLILINNGSTDKTWEWIEDKVMKFPGGYYVFKSPGSDKVNAATLSDGKNPPTPGNITFVKAPTNEGCGIGRNIGLRMLSSDCEYVTLIDNDIVLTSGWDTEMLAFMDSHPEVGICGPMTNFAGTPQLLPKPHPEKIEEIAPFAEKFKANNKGRWSSVPNGFVIIGFCMMIRKRCLDDIGLFDEQFKLYGKEDNDLCIRATKAGWKLAYFGGCYVHHWGSKALGELGAEGIRQWGVNNELFRKKWGAV